MDDISVVYRLDRNTLDDRERLVELPADVRLTSWEPTLLRVIPDNIAFEKIGFIKNWIFHLPRFFGTRKLYSVYSLAAGTDVICQCIVTPSSSRFPFMASDDVQFGLVYTSPSHRNKRFASLMIKAISERLGDTRSYWWLTEVDNLASRKVAETAGFKLVSKAVRRVFVGVSRYSLTH